MNKWYTPAETMIPFSSFVSAIISPTSHFHKCICDYIGVKNCVLGSSGRALLARLLFELSRKAKQERDEVLIPGYTCYSVAASVVRAGLKIRVYDIDPHTFYPDHESIREQMNEKTLAIVIQHLFGIPVSIHEIAEMAGKWGTIVIDDAAQGLGGKFNGFLLGTEGDFGIFSFGRGKPLPLGGGGALIGNDKSILDAVGGQPVHNDFFYLIQTAALRLLSHPSIYGIFELLPLGLGKTVFDPGFSVESMGRSMQRLGSHALGALEWMNGHRRTIAEIYQNNVNPEMAVVIPEGALPVFPRFPVLAGCDPISPELRRLGVRRMYPHAITDEPAIRMHTVRGAPELDGAKEVANLLMTLPTHARISRDQAQLIAHQVNRYSRAA